MMKSIEKIREPSAPLSLTPKRKHKSIFEPRPFAPPETEHDESAYRGGPGLSFDFRNVPIFPLAQRKKPKDEELQMKPSSSCHECQEKAIQAKMTVRAAEDRYEQEADRVADQVMRKIDASSQIQRKEDDDMVQAKPLAPNITPLVHRLGEEMQARPGGDYIQGSPVNPAGGFDAGSDFESRLSALRDGGRPLPDSVRNQMEGVFGADFSGVRVHTGSEASQLNREICARAFTHGNDIYLGENSRPIGTHVGNRLLAHELTHTIQQGGSQTRMAGTHAKAVQRVLNFGPPTTWNDAKEINVVKNIDLPNSVVMSFSDPGSILWIKAGDRPIETMATASLIEEAAGIRESLGPKKSDPKKSGANKWDIRTPRVREAEPADVAGMQTKIQAMHGDFRSRAMLKYRDTHGKMIPLMDDSLINSLKTSLGSSQTANLLAISTHAEGEKMGHDVGAAKGITDDPAKDIWANDENFQRTLGYTSLLDIIIGNTDRMMGKFAPQNWNYMVGPRNKVMYLFDNLDHGAFSGDITAWAQKDLWTGSAIRHDWKGIAEALFETQIIGNSGFGGLLADTEEANIIRDKKKWQENFAMGMEMAFSDLDAIYERLRRKPNPNTPGPVRDVLDRIQYIKLQRHLHYTH